jgi:nucleotidyltransferase/DNA polymerase involved in DNA repair
MFHHWGLKTLGEIAALPADALSARLGQQGLMWLAIARGADVRPLVPDVDDERFEGAIEL